MEGTGATYQGFISCPIKVLDVAYGMVTCDVTEPDVLFEEDHYLLLVVAAILGAAFTGATPKTANSRPRTDT